MRIVHRAPDLAESSASPAARRPAPVAARIAKVIYTQGSEAAIEYLTSPERMAELRNALMELSPDHQSIPPYFQARLTTSVENAVPGNSSLVAVRAITGGS